MMTTMFLPTGVLALSANPAEISTSLGTADFYVEKTNATDVEDFTVTTVANDDLNKMVMGQFVIKNAVKEDIDSLTYYGVMEDAYLPLNVDEDGTGNLVGQFGPATTGFPMQDATSKFKVTFAEAGDYEIEISVFEVATSTTLASCSTTVTVIGYADYTALETAITEANEYIADEGLYTKATIDALKAAVTAAEAVDSKLYADDTDDITTAIDEIEAAILNLAALADYADLTVVYNLGKTYSNADNTYTAATFATLTAALAEVDKDENKELTDQDDVDALTEAIYEAIDGLIKNVEITFTAIAVADDASVEYAKANKIILVFAEPIDDAVNNLVSKLNISDKVVSADWTTDTVYTLSLTYDHGLANGAEVTFDGDETIFTVSGKAMADSKADVIGNLEEAYEEVTATEMSATIVNCNDQPEMVTGDKIVLVFNAPVYGNPDTIEVSGLEATVVAGTYSTVYEIVLDAADTVNGVLTYVDDNGLTIDATLTGSFGSTVIPVVVSAIIEDVDGTAKTAGDKIYVLFSAPTNKVTGATETVFTGVLAGATGEWLSDQALVITIGDTAITESDFIDLSSLNIKDFYGIEDVDTADIALDGSFGTVTAPEALSAEAVDVDGTAKTENDLIIIVFDRPTNGATYVEGLTELGDASASWEEDNTKLIITVGAGATIGNNDSIDISSMGIMDKDGIVEAVGTDLTIEGSFGTVEKPEATRAYAVDLDDEITTAGDQIVVIFDKQTNGADIDLTKAGILTGVAGATFGTTSSFVWEDDDTKLVIIVGDDAVVANGVKINLSGQGIMDKHNIVDATVAILTVEGSFGYTIAPRITKAVAFSENQVDYIRIFFNTEVTVPTEESFTTTFDISAGASHRLVDNGNGFTYYEIAMDPEDHGPFTSGSYTISLNGIYDKATQTMAVTNSVAIAGGFVSPITPEVLKVVAISATGDGIAKSGDKIVAVFNTEVTIGTVETTSGYLGTGYEVKYAEGTKNVVEIILGNAGLDVTPQTTEIIFKGFMDDSTQSVTMEDTKVALEGNFGYSEKPEIMSATVVSKNGNGIPEAGDKIVVVFNTLVKAVNENVEADYKYTYVLTDEDIAASDFAYDIGDTFEITVWSDATGIKYPLESVIDGSYGYSEEPVVQSAVLAIEDGKEVIRVVFDREVTGELSGSLYTKNNHLAQDVVAAWDAEDGEANYILKITLGRDATTTEDDVLNLSGLGIKSKATGIEVKNLEAIAITGSRVSVVKKVEFIGDGKIEITFSSRTNGVADLSKIATLVGTDARATWKENNTVLTITLGGNHTATDGSYIIFNDMGICDGFSGVQVIGQYKIEGSITGDKMTITRIVARGKDSSKKEALNGDNIIFKFASATNLGGAVLEKELYATEISSFISVSGGNDVMLGAGYTGKWTAYDTFEITLGDNPAIAVGAKITVSNIAFANGSGIMDTCENILEGDFSGREFTVSNGEILRTNGEKSGDYRVKAEIGNNLVADGVTPTVVCVGYKGSSPVSVMRIQIDIDSTITPVFEFAEGFGITSAKIYVFGDVFADINGSPIVMADTYTIKK